MKSKIERRGKAFPQKILFLVLLFLSLCAYPVVQCIWVGDGYNCSGDGNEISVIGGGSNVTNDLGYCNNCSIISPEDLRRLAQSLSDSCDDIRQLVRDTELDLHNEQFTVEQKLDEIATYRTFEASAAGRAAATNYMVTVDNDQSAAMRYAHDNVGTTLFSSRQAAAQGAGNGVYYYANNSEAPALRSVADSIENARHNLQAADGVISYIKSDIVNPLFDGARACTPSDGGSSTNDPSGGGSTPSTGDWCTYEQGEALKSLLRGISNEVVKVEVYLNSISGYVENVSYIVRTGLFTEYNAIPSASGLGDSWQSVYLDGAETNWGYQPTNILARIELLLYGMSGVGTNENQFTEGEMDSTEVLDNLDNTSEDVSTQIRAISSDADGSEVQSLGQALISFFNQFSISGDTASEGTELWPSSVFHIGNEEYEIPTFTPTSGGAAILNHAQSFCRVACIVVYLVLGAVVVFRFWAWFSEKAAKLSKWAIELITSLFAS